MPRLALYLFGVLACGAVSSAEFLFIEGFEPRQRPATGAVIVTEVMSAPAQVPQSAGEWFEITNVGIQRADLAGCIVSDDSAAQVVLPALELVGGESGALVRNSNPLSNGGVNAVATFSFALGATDSVRLRCDGALIDETSWSAEQAGSARSLDPDFHSASGNDDPARWCLAVTPYGDGDFGTPGSANPQCADPGGVEPAPLAGQVLVNEVMPDPTGALADGSAEWIELRHAGVARVGLETCVLDNGAGSSALSITSVEPGSLLVFARSANAVANGGLNVQGVFAFGLPNSNGIVRLVCGSTVISQLSYTTIVPGRSVIRDADGTICNAPDGTVLYAPENFGTPGFLNTPECP